MAVLGPLSYVFLRILAITDVSCLISTLKEMFYYMHQKKSVKTNDFLLIRGNQKISTEITTSLRCHILIDKFMLLPKFLTHITTQRKNRKRKYVLNYTLFTYNPYVVGSLLQRKIFLNVNNICSLRRIDWYGRKLRYGSPP